MQRWDREAIRRERVALKCAYRRAYALLGEILFREDPIGINFEVNTDEYEPEVGTILPRLHEACSVDGVRRIVHEEFVKWFGPAIAGPPERYQVVAESVWTQLLPLLRR